MVNAPLMSEPSPSHQLRRSTDSAPPATAPDSPVKRALQGVLRRVLLGTLAITKRIPLPLRSRVGWYGGYLAGHLPLRERRIAELQLQMVFGPHEARRLTPRVFAHVGRTFLESLNLTPFFSSPGQLTCKQWEMINPWKSHARPMVVLTAHTGNWDLLAAYTIAEGFRVTTIGREARNPAVQSALAALRDAYGVETIWRSDKLGVKRLMTCLRENRVVAALIDQDTRVDSEFVPFFAIPAKTPSSLIALGKKYNARFVSAFLLRQLDGTYEMFVRELDATQDAIGMLSEYHAHLEALIREYPDQWVWFHKRWRSQPGEKTMSTKEYLRWLERRCGTAPVTDHPQTQPPG